MANKRVELLWIGRDGGVRRRYWDGSSWSTSVPLGGLVASPPVPFPGTTQSVQAYVLGLDHAIWYETWA